MSHHSPQPADGARCSGGGATIALPVLSTKPAKPKSRMGKWRAAALITVHLLILAHILQWVITGSTLSPVEPSEAMQTLELGDINAGFIFFVVAILATLVFGRYFCGWGCHVVALQDSCTWLMHKLGVRPKPFRSRLLVWAPLGFGLYMFVWPTFKRLALLPGLEALGLKRPLWLREAAEFHGFGSQLIVTDFWATFPPWYIAIPFFIVIGFIAVYFLGSKGFCTYGCPYGGIFGVVDRFSPGRIVVNDNCHQCGHCTAVCTSNVRVHEEVRDFGMVVNPGCMKCMDCVSACPNDALSFAFATPPAFRKPVDEAAKSRQQASRKNPKRYDLTWPEEITLALVFIALFLAFRGMLNVIPMLMAAGMAGVGAFVIWKGWRLLTTPNVRVQSLVLRHKGRYRPAGLLAIFLALSVLASAAWSGTVASLRYSARLEHQSLTIPIAVVFRPEFAPSQADLNTATSGARAFTRSETIGWALNAEQKRELAYLSLVAGDAARAESLLADIIRTGNPTEELIRQHLALAIARGADQNEQLSLLEAALDRHTHLLGLAPDIARLRVATTGSIDAADAFWKSLLETHPQSPLASLQAAEYFIATRRPERAAALLPDLASITDIEAGIVGVRVLLKLSRPDEARALLTTLSSNDRLSLAAVRVLASLWNALNDPEQALELVERASIETPASAGLHELLGQFHLARGDTAAASVCFTQALRTAEGNPWMLLSLGESITLAGLQAGNAEVRDIGLSAYQSAQLLAPHAPLIAHDSGMALLAAGRTDEGLESLAKAIQLAPGNAAIEQSVAEARRRLPRAE